MAEVSTDIDPPLDLSPYVKGNALLPTHLYPVLEGHLSHLTESIDRLDNEILALESLLDATRKAQRLLKQERRAHSKIKAPIRRIPPELLGVIFGCLFGDSPFEAGEYRQFTRLASVCAAWREIMYTTPQSLQRAGYRC
ncbi:hypothetical protein BKA70DRAFT_693430 [Coprinopsis sp. MPI-PUGE-AT-0042]|nr:hypothetical protein BKA70DRAFT_693430 [Coprinopsis sp. MPI-PUGE-AT-0042]